jgi:hypothetical protein
MTDRSPSAASHAKRLAQAAAARAATADLVPAPAEQLALPVPPAPAPGSALEARQAGAAAQLPLGNVAEQEPLAGPRQGGRPRGAINRKTAEWQAHMLARYRSPLVVMAETYSRPIGELAAALGCTPLEAFQLQLKAATELAPFLHSKMPTAVQLDGAPLAGITLAVTPGIAMAIGLDSAPIEILENQDVSEGEP